MVAGEKAETAEGMVMKCPGQDKGYWKGDPVFDLPCPKCGAAVEFFRDENARRCGQCGYRFNNARIALDCAAWCDHAEMCIGVVRPRPGGQVDTAIVGRVIQALEKELSPESAEFAWALLVFQHAKELVAPASVDPRVVLPAALLLNIHDAATAAMDARNLPGALAGRSRVEEILSRAGLDGETVGSVSALIAAYHEGREADTAELAVLHDSCRLARLVQEGIANDPERLESAIAHAFQTEAGKARAQSLFNQ